MEEIFKERQTFKQKVSHYLKMSRYRLIRRLKVIENVQKELDQFGLCIYNANFKELQDTLGSEYFAFLGRKAHGGASNQARIDVAEARMRGEIGEAAKKGHIKQKISKIDAETAVLETRRKGDKAQAGAELTNCETELNMNVQLAQIRAKRAAESRDAELQKDVEQKKAETELERLRAKDLARWKNHRETAQHNADAKFYNEMKPAECRNYQQMQAADATYYNEVRGADGRVYANRQDAETGLLKTTKAAEGIYFCQIKEADAAFYAKKKEGEGIEAMAHAYKSLGEAFGGS